MRKIALLAALAALVVAAFGASMASADVLPNNTAVSGSSSNATLTIGSWTITCNSNTSFNTGTTNGPVATTTTFGPSCSPSATVTTSAGWTIESHEIGGSDNTTDESSTSTTTVNAPKGTTIALVGCTITIQSAAVATGTYTDGSSSLSVSATGLSWTASGFFCVMGTSGTNAGFSANYTLSAPAGGLTVR